MSKLTVVAHIRAKADQIALVQSELEKLLAPTRKEPGCLQYDLHQDSKDPAHFVFLEAWSSREHLQTHLDAQPIRDYLAAVQGAVESFVIHELSQIG